MRRLPQVPRPRTDRSVGLPESTFTTSRRWTRLTAAVVTAAVCLGAAAQAGARVAPPAGPVYEKTLYVSDNKAFGGDGGVIKVNVDTGVRTVVSKNSAPRQPNGPDFAGPQRLAVEADGNILVVGQWNYAGGILPGVVRIDPQTGTRSIVSLNGVSAGIVSFGLPTGIAVEASGDIIVNDCNVPGPQADPDAIIRVDPNNGFRTPLSTDAAPASTPALEFGCPTDVAVEHSGSIVAPQAAGNPDMILRVDPVTGARSLVSRDDNPAGAPAYGELRGIDVGNQGKLLVTDVMPLPNFLGVLATTHSTGVRSEVSRNSNPVGAPEFFSPFDLTQFDDNNKLFVTSGDQSGQPGSDPQVIGVRRSDGHRTVTSANNAPVGAPDFAAPVGIDIGPLELAGGLGGPAEIPHDANAARAAHPRFKYRLAGPAKMTFTIDQRLPGRVKGLRDCVAKTAKNHTAPACTRYVKAGSFTVSARKGLNRTPFDGAIHGHRLARGTYRALVTGMGKGGIPTKPVSATFKVR